MKHVSLSSTRWLIAGILVLTLCFGLVGSAQAVVIDRDGTLPAGEVVDDDLVLTANTILVDGTVNGTLIAAGQSITINGLIKSDAIIAGQVVILGEKAVIEGNLFTGGAEVVLRGKVLGSVFGGAATLTLAETASVGRNIYYGGYQFESKPGSKTGRDIYAAGYQHILGGDCRNIGLAGTAMELNGAVSGSATLYLGGMGEGSNYFRPMVFGTQMPPSLPEGLRIGDAAKISGKLTYTSPVEQSAGFKTTPAGGTVYQTPVPSVREKQPTPGIVWHNNAFGASFWLWDLLRNLATILILGALVIGLLPNLFQRAVEQLSAHSLGSIGMGFLGVVLSFFVFPLAVVVIVLVGLLFGVTTLFDLSGIALSVGFTGLGAACLAFTTILFWAGKLLLSFIIGKWVLGKVLPSAAAGRLWPFVTGAVLFALLAAIPVVGFLFSFVVALAGLGAMWYVWRSRAVRAS